MAWVKRGLVFAARADGDWCRSHATIPTPLPMPDGRLRVFYSACDAGGLARPTFVDLDPAKSFGVLRHAGRPLLDFGAPGSFDDNGLMVTSVVAIDDRTLFMYYVGFELGTRIRYRLFTGLAISEDGGETFLRYSRAPILDRSDQELYFRCGPQVVREGDRFRMWYIAGSEWVRVGDKELPRYTVHYAESPDGIVWPDRGVECLAPASDNEHGFGRPWVVRRDGRYEMYLSVRRRDVGAYRLGFARSTDGIAWRRDDEALAIDVSPTGWDSEAVMYAASFEHRGHSWLFYNGNNFGEAGFGLAERVID